MAPKGIEPSPRVLQTHVRTSYTTEANFGGLSKIQTSQHLYVVEIGIPFTLKPINFGTFLINH